ncbi:PaaI family thioesterase [Pseudomonas sp. B21-023]|uniref:PaaI family thioesterase n=1 Tax=unclassified Pseudomonas TaxID=196821 RepID=UPI00111AB750|nr:MULTISPECIES: PaaI family thioesterase [unclassified Pseudomonas]UVL21190.1 PaaI family thioesterase [Pseudomonas sp. B21-044]UVM18596.1 PaaI family thioesterase [Pseudomonas sp. B21-023]
MTEQALSLQQLAAPEGICYGCGCSHPSGLHVQSHWDADGIHLWCRHTPDPTFTGWPGLVYGGLLAMLVDCHSNWTAMACHYRAEGREPGTLPRIDCVTGQLGLTYLKPTPMGVELLLKARVEGELGRKTRVICEVWAGDVLTVTADSVFVRVDTQKLRDQAHGKE